MFITPAMTSDLADAHRRELYAAAARRRLLRTARLERARSAHAAERASGLAGRRRFALTPREGTR